MANYNGTLEDSSGNKLLPTPISMGNIESDTASQAYTIGEHLVYNNRFYEVIALIAQDDTLVPNTNIKETDIATINYKLTASDGTEFSFQDLIDGNY